MRRLSIRDSKTTLESGKKYTNQWIKPLQKSRLAGGKLIQEFLNHEKDFFMKKAIEILLANSAEMAKNVVKDKNKEEK